MLSEKEAMMGPGNSAKPRSALNEAEERIVEYRDAIRKVISGYCQQMDRLVGVEPETQPGAAVKEAPKEIVPCDLDRLFKSIDELGYTVKLLATQLSRMDRLAG